MNISEQLKRQRDVDDLKEKLRAVNSSLSFYQNRVKDSHIAIEAYDLLRLEVLQELVDLGEILPSTVS